MKILKITLITVISSVLMVLPSTAKELRIGVAAGWTNINADGTETMKDSGKENTTEASENAIIPSIFADIAADNGIITYYLPFSSFLLTVSLATNCRPRACIGSRSVSLYLDHESVNLQRCLRPG